MKVLTQNKWEDGYLDYYRSAGEYRVKVLAIKNLEKLEDIYIVRPKSLRMVWNYLRKYGSVAVIRKIKSRLSEEARNEKYISCGLGIIVEAPESAREQIGTKVVCILPFHPAATERVVLSKNLFSEYRGASPTISENKVLHMQPDKKPGDSWWKVLRGWSAYSGIELKDEVCTTLLNKATEVIAKEDWNRAGELPVSQKSPIYEFKKIKEAPASSKKKVILFGLGNYAKVQIIPNIKKYVELVGIHEIDPTQIPINIDLPLIDSSPEPREQEKYDALFIAGYHHAHTPLAIKALQNGAYAVVEKPVAVDRNQLNILLETLRQSQGKLFIGFHKRYSPFNALAIKDFKISHGEPISYHCMVHEPKYPKYFWYNWPNSKGPIVENGCHWIDHFLYLNNFAKPIRSEVFVAKNGIINASAELENGACFTMVLSGEGSDYIGVQDYVELKTEDKTIKIINDDTYIAEGKDLVIRKKKINKMLNYRLMYQTIGEKIMQGENGDTLESVLVSTKLIFDLEDKYNQLKRAG